VNLSEQKDLNCYKTLLTTLGEYVDKFPATGVDKMLKNAIENGMKVLPKDEKALDILKCILMGGKNVPATVQDLLNLRFTDLVIECRPVYLSKSGKKEIAFWSKNGTISDKVLSLIDFSVEGKSYWCNAEGEKINLEKGE